MIMYTCDTEEQEWCLRGADSGWGSEAGEEMCLPKAVSHAQDHRWTVPRKMLWLLSGIVVFYYWCSCCSDRYRLFHALIILYLCRWTPPASVSHRSLRLTPQPPSQKNPVLLCYVWFSHHHQSSTSSAHFMYCCDSHVPLSHLISSHLYLLNIRCIT